MISVARSSEFVKGLSLAWLANGCAVKVCIALAIKYLTWMLVSKFRNVLGNGRC